MPYGVRSAGDPGQARNLNKGTASRGLIKDGQSCRNLGKVTVKHGTVVAGVVAASSTTGRDDFSNGIVEATNTFATVSETSMH
jgi:hypothetical protein